MNRDVSLMAKLAMFVRIIGRCVCEDPRCGVLKKQIPVTDSRIFLNDLSSIWAVTNAY